MMQYFVPKDNNRLKEIQFCLKKCMDNKYIDKIILINEKKYSNEELGFSEEYANKKENKLEQIINEKRLNFKDIFDHIESLSLNGFVVFCNSDIFSDGR